MGSAETAVARRLREARELRERAANLQRAADKCDADAVGFRQGAADYLRAAERLTVAAWRQRLGAIVGGVALVVAMWQSFDVTPCAAPGVGVGAVSVSCVPGASEEWSALPEGCAVGAAVLSLDPVKE